MYVCVVFFVDSKYCFAADDERSYSKCSSRTEKKTKPVSFVKYIGCSRCVVLCVVLNYYYYCYCEYCRCTVVLIVSILASELYSCTATLKRCGRSIQSKIYTVIRQKILGKV